MRQKLNQRFLKKNNLEMCKNNLPAQIRIQVIQAFNGVRHRGRG
jgi:hypothetical protein